MSNLEYEKIVRTMVKRYLIAALLILLYEIIIYFVTKSYGINPNIAKGMNILELFLFELQLFLITASKITKLKYLTCYDQSYVTHKLYSDHFEKFNFVQSIITLLLSNVLARNTFRAGWILLSGDVINIKFADGYVLNYVINLSIIDFLLSVIIIGYCKYRYYKAINSKNI